MRCLRSFALSTSGNKLWNRETSTIFQGESPNVLDPTPYAAYQDSGMVMPPNAGGRKYTSHVANVKKRIPGTEAGKRLYAVMGIVALAFTMNADVKCEEVHMGLFSVRLPVIAILHGDLFVGEAVAYLNRKGTIDLRSVLDEKGKCSGRFRFTDAKTGVADMQCNDGSAARLSFSALSSFSGYGSGSTPNGPASFTFGLRPEDAALHLILPPGKKLVEGSEGLRLEPVKS